MPRPSITWLITDTHFNHDLMYRVGRPADFKEKIIHNCIKLITKQDTLIHLGDVIFYDYKELKGLLGLFPGKKILVRGNHDRKSNSWYERNGFTFVADYLVLGEVILSHKPIRQFPDGVLYNIHGHWHDNDHRTEESHAYYDPNRHFKLAIEETNYMPVKFQEFLSKRKPRDAASNDNKDLVEEASGGASDLRSTG